MFWCLHVFIYLSHSGPVLPHPFTHSCLYVCLIICFAVLSVVGFGGCVLSEPCFASLSALSLPCMSVCPGIHCIVNLMAWLVFNLSARMRICCMSSSVFCPSIDCSIDIESVKMTMLVEVAGESVNFLSRCSKVLSIARFSAS